MIKSSHSLTEIMSRHQVDTVIHFAASSLVGESTVDPLKYYENNVSATAHLLRAMVNVGVKRIVFSSTAAVYGEPVRTPIEETDLTVPTNPYGETKLSIEKMLRWCYQAYGIQSICLRYFNAAGAHPNLTIGEDHRPETHLIPLVLQVALGQREAISVYGNDYATKDGTCIRDYVHVMDLASAHRLAVQRLRLTEVGQECFNLGNGTGFSVKKVIEVARIVTGEDIHVQLAPRRHGDPEILVASSKLAKTVLGWQPNYTALSKIIETAWQWHRRNPTGYK